MVTAEATRAESATPHKAVVLAVILGCQLMTTLDASIITTALPHIQDELAFSDASLSWIQNSYVLAFGGLLLLGARTGDLWGRRRTFIAGVAVFTAASLLAGLAPSAGTLVAARALQGVASAFTIPSTLALLITSFPAAEERSRAIAVYSAVIGAGASVGIIVGGVFTQFASWRWGLLINVPLGILVALATPRVLPETPRQPGRVDVSGAVAVTVGMSALVYGLVEAAERGWTSERTLVSLAVAIIAISAFIIIEKRQSQPITPLRLFASVERSGAYLGRMLIVGATFSMFFFLSQYLQDVKGFSPLATGFAYIPITAMFFAMVYVVRFFKDRVDTPTLLLVSLIVALLGMAMLGRISATTTYFPGIVLPLLVIGVGQGIAIILFTELGMSGVAPDDAGAGSGLVNTAHQLGGSIGLALLAVVFGAASGGSVVPTLAAQSHAFASVFAVATWFFAGAVMVAVVIYVAHRRQSPRVTAPATPSLTPATHPE